MVLLWRVVNGSRLLGPDGRRVGPHRTQWLLSNATTYRQPAGHLRRDRAIEHVVAQRVEKGDERGRVVGNVQP